MNKILAIIDHLINYTIWKRKENTTMFAVSAFYWFAYCLKFIRKENYYFTLNLNLNESFNIVQSLSKNTYDLCVLINWTVDLYF